MSDKYIVIGDIHGCVKSLKELIGNLVITKDQILIFLGDYVDRGVDSKGVIDYLIELNNIYNCVFLMGNHEYMMLEYIKNGSSPNWFYNGAHETLHSYGKTIPEKHVEFIQNLLYYYDTPEYFFVHAGLHPDIKVEDSINDNDIYSFLWGRAHMLTERINSNNFIWEKTVVCGHTVIKEPLITDKLICIDTGCVFHSYGKLTAISLPSKKITQIINTYE